MLKKDKDKYLLLSCIKESLNSCSKIQNKIKIHAYCVMDNHFHHLVNYQNGHKSMSDYLHHSNTLLGIRYNKINKRTGKFAEDRPKTCLIENYDHSLRVHFYIEANPILAGKYKKLSQLKKDIYNSYSFYAFGFRTPFTDLLTIPEWYKELGPTDEERQLKYRNLFAKYLIEMGLNKFDVLDNESKKMADELIKNTELVFISRGRIKIETYRMLSFYIGNLEWKLGKIKKYKDKIKKRN